MTIQQQSKSKEEEDAAERLKYYISQEDRIMGLSIVLRQFDRIDMDQFATAMERDPKYTANPSASRLTQVSTTLEL